MGLRASSNRPGWRRIAFCVAGLLSSGPFASPPPFRCIVNILPWLAGMAVAGGGGMMVTLGSPVSGASMGAVPARVNYLPSAACKLMDSSDGPPRL